MKQKVCNELNGWLWRATCLPAASTFRSVVALAYFDGSHGPCHNPQWYAAAVPIVSVTTALLVLVVNRIFPDGRCDSTPTRMQHINTRCQSHAASTLHAQKSSKWT